MGLPESDRQDVLVLRLCRNNYHAYDPPFKSTTCMKSHSLYMRATSY